MDRTCIRAATAAAFTIALGGVALAQTADFLKQEGPDAWRASKLAGVAIYGPDRKKVGDITDVLLDHSGKATAVVIGVGGFLGLGEKDVAVPFDQVTFTQDPLNPPQSTAAAGGVATNQANQANGAGTPATTGLGMPADTVGDPNAPGAQATAPGMNSAPSSGAGGAAPTLGSPAASTTGTGVVGGNGMAAVPTGTAARSTSYPDHGTIALTADQLKMAPTFQFAR